LILRSIRLTFWQRDTSFSTLLGKSILEASLQNMEDLMTMTETTSEPQTLESRSDPRQSTSSFEQKQHNHNKPPNRTQSLSIAASRLKTHTRSASVTAPSPTNRNRLSLSFPVLASGNGSISPKNHSPSSSLYSTTNSSSSAEVDPSDSAGFLTALAAQERRVLELREELSKAESELTKLKRQWANHEAQKTRQELILNVNFILPQRSVDVQESLASPSTREKFERRQQRATASSNRKVLPSQKHQRTLSLLSPDRVESRQLFPQSKDLDSDSGLDRFIPVPSKRHSLMNPVIKEVMPSDLSRARPHSLDLEGRPNDQDILLKASKQLAEGFRDGLWNFFEDIKQATVGDDVSRAPLPPNSNNTSHSVPVRQRASKSNLKNVSTETHNGATMNLVGSKDKEPKFKNSASSRDPEGQEMEESLIDFGQDDDRCFRWSSSTLPDYPDHSGAPTPPSRTSTPRTFTRFVISPSPHHFIFNPSNKQY
jgi:hypothetical protein